MKNRIIPALTLIAVLAPAAAMAWPWSWDMSLQPSNRAQKFSAPPAPKDSVPVQGETIPMKTMADGLNVANSVQPTDESLERGKHIYDLYCAICHGPAGLGDGLVGKKYMSPADLTSDWVQKMPDGAMYFVVTYGGVGKDLHMPGYAESIAPRDRWHLINYIKNIITWNAK